MAAKDETKYRRAEHTLFDDAGINPNERWIVLPTLGVRTRVLEVGRGTPVVFLHGGPNAAATWSYVAGKLEGVRAILVDRPGTGLSDPPPQVPDHVRLPRYVSRLSVDVLDALDLPRAALAGSSLGGYSALRTAAEFSDRVSRVVLAGCPPFIPGWSAPGFFTLLRTPVLGRLLPSLPANDRSLRMSLGQMGHRKLLDRGGLPPAMKGWIKAWQNHTLTMQNDAAMIRACGTWRGGFDPSLELGAEELAAITAPCLVLGGTDDPLGGEEVLSQLVAALPAASLRMTEGAGHLPWLDDATRVAREITHFVTANHAV